MRPVEFTYTSTAVKNYTICDNHETANHYPRRVGTRVVDGETAYKRPLGVFGLWQQPSATVQHFHHYEKPYKLWEGIKHVAEIQNAASLRAYRCNFSRKNCLREGLSADWKVTSYSQYNWFNTFEARYPLYRSYDSKAVKDIKHGFTLNTQGIFQLALNPHSPIAPYINARVKITFRWKDIAYQQVKVSDHQQFPILQYPNVYFLPYGHSNPSHMEQRRFYPNFGQQDKFYVRTTSNTHSKTYIYWGGRQFDQGRYRDKSKWPRLEPYPREQKDTWPLFSVDTVNAMSLDDLQVTLTVRTQGDNPRYFTITDTGESAAFTEDIPFEDMGNLHIAFQQSIDQCYTNCDWKAFYENAEIGFEFFVDSDDSKPLPNTIHYYSGLKKFDTKALSSAWSTFVRALEKTND